MTDKLKKLARAHSAKTGMSYQASLNALRVAPLPVTPDAERHIDEIVARLASPIFAVKIGRSPAISIANANATEPRDIQLSRGQQFYVETGAQTLIVSEAQARALIVAGAADVDTEMLRSYRNDARETFSVRCPACSLWIWCGESEHSATCYCGQSYRVVFDRAPVDWTLEQGQHCLDCGGEKRTSTEGDAVRPWQDPSLPM